MQQLINDQLSFRIPFVIRCHVINLGGGRPHRIARSINADTNMIEYMFLKGGSYLFINRFRQFGYSTCHGYTLIRQR